MQYIAAGTYIIFSSLGSKMCIGTSSDKTVLQLQTFDKTVSSNTWLVTPIGGSFGFNLEHQDTGNCARFGQTPIKLLGLSGDPNNMEFVLICDELQDGYVAINNHDRTRVFDLSQSKTSAGSAIIAFPWNGGGNQWWRFVPTASLDVPSG